MPAKPAVLARRLLAQTGIFRIEGVDLVFANGARRTFERILGGASSVMVAPLRDDGTILLTREYATGTDRYELGLPKGIVEPGEDPLVAANRELQEEVGYAARDLRGLSGAASLWITSEKDALKIAPHHVGAAEVLTLVVELEVEGARDLLDWIESRLR